MTMIAQGGPKNLDPVNPPPNISRDPVTGHYFAAYSRLVVENADWVFEVPDGWTAGTQTLNLRWRAPAVTTGDVVWAARVEALSAEDGIDTSAVSSFAAAQTVTDTAPPTAGDQTVAQITFSVPQADDMAAFDMFRVRIFRDRGDAADNMLDDAQLMRFWWDDAA